MQFMSYIYTINGICCSNATLIYKITNQSRWKRDFLQFSYVFKDTYREKAPSNKTPVFAKVGIWAFGSLVHQTNSLLRFLN